MNHEFLKAKVKAASSLIVEIALMTKTDPQVIAQNITDAIRDQQAKHGPLIK